MKKKTLRLIIVATVAPLLAAVGVVAALAWRGHPGVQLAASAIGAALQLPPFPDTDGDGVYDQLESALGSNPANPTSMPESHAKPDADGNGVADVCEDFADNDQDGLTDGDDPGCRMDDLIVDLNPGLDVFGSSARIEAGSLGPGFPPEDLSLTGPVVVKRGESNGGTLPVEIVAMQLSGNSTLGRVTLIEDPHQASIGGVTSTSGAPPWSSFFDVFTEVFVEGQPVGQEKIRVTNPRLDWLHPVQDSRKVDQSKCYQFPGGLHCPEVPRLKLPVLKWVAKFDCVEQPSTPPPFLGPVKPGDYATKIVIHNPQGVPVNFEKKVAVGLRNPQYGQISQFKSTTLPPDATTEVDCLDILGLLELV